MKRNILVKTLILGMVFFMSSFSLQAQTPKCSSSAAAVAQMWNSYGTWNPSISTQAYAALVRDAVSSWNNYARNRWATIGPRHLALNNRQATGTILGQTNRTFVTVPARGNSVTITLRKTDGRAKTGVTICTQTKNGTRRTVHSYTFNNGNYTKTKTFTINNAKGKVISINMRNYSVGNKFKYTVKASN
ncbi:MAG: hypothetical protein AAGD28_06485 [Bacteroidota bacterium]